MPIDTPKRKVLIADDEHAIGQTAAAILNHNGFEAVAVLDGESAVRLAAEWKPDVLLTDINMPGLNGLATALRVCAVLPNCRVILFSAQHDWADSVRDYCGQGYQFEFIQKPIHPYDLLAQLRTELPRASLWSPG